ncbi:hypothetical protein RHMOL_Rhmol07G0279200 [Rhododendron molle]|uniref:Uncharacterized protein n=1 Tax=Rhododendron molle TaxID=49168 RepID=A0ACC0N795_RHOML|nr:hypothetical protein RHMOL_Rhmol07G0279200 [Rhododendron molle]
MVFAEVPKLGLAAEYFFKMRVEGKRFRPTGRLMDTFQQYLLCLLSAQVLLLMGTALNVHILGPPDDVVDLVVDALSEELRLRQQYIAEITEMIHLAVLAGDFLLSRACVASLKNTELFFFPLEFVVSLLATVLEHLVTGETMQMTTTSEQHCSMEYYLQKTYYKTVSLISNNCKAIALLAGQTAEVSTLAYEYGKNVGIVTAPILFAMEEYPQLRAVVNRGFEGPADVDLALDYLGKSQGIQRMQELVAKHATLAATAIDSLPESDDEDVRRSRRALVDLTQRVITRTK